MKTNHFLEQLQNGQTLSVGQLLQLTIQLSISAILAQMTQVERLKQEIYKAYLF